MELFRKTVLADNSVSGALHHQVPLLLQNSSFMLLLAFAVALTFVILCIALCRFRNRESPHLIYLAGIITIYIAFCIKKARSSSDGAYGDEGFYRNNSSRLSLSERLVAAASSDYLGKKIAFFLKSRDTASSGIGSRSAESADAASFVLEDSNNPDNKESSALGDLKEVSENYYGNKNQKNDSDIGTVKKSSSQVKHPSKNPLASSDSAKGSRNSDREKKVARTVAEDAEEVMGSGDVKSSGKDAGTDAEKYKEGARMYRFPDEGAVGRSGEADSQKGSAGGEQKFFREIQLQVRNKKRVDDQLDGFKKSIHIAGVHAAGLVESLRKNYRVFSALSRSIKDRLLSMGISTDLYAYELDELEKEVLEKYTLQGPEYERDTGTKKVDEAGRKAVELSSENPSSRKGTNSRILDVLRKVKDTKKRLFEEENRPQTFNLIKRKLQVIEFYLTLEGIVCLALVLVVLAEMHEYVAILKLVLIVALLVNIYIGMFIMPDGWVLEKHCKRRLLEGCKQGTHTVNEIVRLLSQDAKLEHQVDVVNKEFSRISSDAKHKIQGIRKYLDASLNSHVDVKILVFETFIDKIKSMEESFDKAVGDDVDKIAFYNTVDAMKKDLENIKGFLKSMNTAKILDVYQGLFQVEYFFSHERKRVVEKIENIVDADTNELGRKKKQRCIEFIEEICNSQKEHDSLSFILVFFPILFAVLLLL